MAKRVGRTGRCPYITPSNRMILTKTKQKGLLFRRMKKPARAQKCGDCKSDLRGVLAMRPAEFARQNKAQRTVNRTYGGTLCSECTVNRILKSFLTEEQQQVSGLAQ